MKKVLIGLVVVLILCPLSGIAKGKGINLEGTYMIKGYNPGKPTTGTPNYTGTLDVTRSGGAYLLDWKIGEGGKQTYKGIGIYADGVFSVGFNGGVVSYKVEGDVLKGVWAPYKGGSFGYEFCEKK